MLFQLIYVSQATPGQTDSILAEIQRKAEECNAKNDITGVLLYSAGNFLQLLEGRLQSIAALFERIASDPRHTRVQVVHLGSVPERAFPSWSMGVFNVDKFSPGLDRTELLHRYVQLHDIVSREECWSQAVGLFDYFAAHAGTMTGAQTVASAQS